MKSNSLLLVDDDQDTTKILSEILEGKGYKVDVSRNGINALEKVKEKKYAAVILDYVMPYLNGDEVAERIKDIDPGVGILLITGHKRTLNERRLNDFDFILEKPIGPDQVVKTLKKVISFKAAHKPSLLLVDDDKETTDILSEILAVKGYDVDISRNGFNAIEKIKKKSYEAIILDYMMPYLNGDEVAGRIKEIDPKARILLVTGYKQTINDKSLIDFEFILEKPVNPSQVLKALRRVISNKATQEVGKKDEVIVST